MESQIVSATPNPARTFLTGSTVIYGLLGKCRILAIETRAIGGDSQPYYKLEIVRSSFSRSSKPEPAIWLPVASAAERGLRAPLHGDEVAGVLALLSSREYFFPLDAPWNLVQARLENTIRGEGALGLAKAVSYLYVLKRKRPPLPADALKLQGTVNRLLLKELSEATGETMRTLEDRLARDLRRKLAPDV